MAHILAGIRVADLSRLLPGPFCTQLLGDLGAEVIKVEMPGEGDWSRGLRTAIRGYGSSFLMLNRSKKSMTLNLKHPAGIEVMRRLASCSDVLVESFRPGVTGRLGISYHDLKTDNPRLVYCSLTGFGQTGPYADRAGHDINFMSYAGLCGLTGPRGGKPVPPAIQAGDVAGGALMAAFGVMSALYHREVTGRGQYIDAAMMDGLLAAGQTLVGEFQSTGRPPETGNMRLSGGYPVYNIYETKDGGYVSLGALEERFWNRFCELCGRDDLKKLHKSGWDRERDLLEDELKKLFKGRTRDEWTELLAAEDTCFSPVLGIDEAMNDPQVRARGMVLEGPHPDGGTVRQVAFPIKFSEADTKEPAAAPKLGEHTQEVLKSLGYEDDQIDKLRQDGVI